MKFKSIKPTLETAILIVSICVSYFIGTYAGEMEFRNSNEFHNSYVNMNEVSSFNATEDGLQLYFEDGSGYWWES